MTVKDFKRKKAAVALFGQQSGIAHVGNRVGPNVFIHEAIIRHLNFHCHL